MTKWNTAAYVRLSSDDGDKAESNSITNQKSLIDLYLKNNKDLKLKDYYIDDGFTGTDFDRPDFQRLLLDMKNGKINTIIVKDLSRLGRNYIEVGNYLEQIFPLYNIRFIAINDNIDSFKDPKSINNVVVPFKNLMNDEYARDISNKVKSVLNTKKTNGEFTGISAPYGYKKDPKDKHKFIVDKKASKVVKKIFNMILDGKTKSEVLDELNKCEITPPALYKMKESIANGKKTDTMHTWNMKMLDRILQNQSYTGDLIQGKRKRISHKVHKLIHTDSEDWIIVPNHHIPLISKEKFEHIQSTIYNRDNRVCKNGKYDIFAGHLKCKECENSFTIRKSKGYEYYYCTSYIKQKLCSKHTTEKSKLEKDVLDIMNNQINMLINVEKTIDEILKEENINYDIEILNNRLEEIDTEAEKYKTLKNSIKDDYENEYINKEEYIEYEKEYNHILSNLKKDKIKINERIEKTGFKSERNKEWIEIFKRNQNIKQLSKKVIDELVENIFIDKNNNIKIKFKYEDEFFEAIDFIKNHNCDIINNEFLLA